MKGSTNMSNLISKGELSVDDYYALPEEGMRYELIWGRLYAMAAPSVQHQDILRGLLVAIDRYLSESGKNCKVYPAPFDVNLNPTENDTMVQPDISVICDPKKTENGACCLGAPDLVVEITSKSNTSRDYIDKADAYVRAGVREYWIVDPVYSRIIVYSDIRDGIANGIAIYGLRDKVKSFLYKDMEIDFSKIV